MKKRFGFMALLLAVLCVVSLTVLPTAVHAGSEESLTYIVVNGEAIITGCDTSVNGNFVIPSTLGGYPVTAIDNEAFASCGVTSVTIPDSVTRIGDGAFSWCRQLTSISIPDSVISIGPTVFYRCTNLESVIIPNTVTCLESHTFFGCTSLNNIVIPDGVTSIGDSVFNGCTSLTNVAIPDSVTNFGIFVFNDCTSLTSIAIPQGVSNIGRSMFKGCTNLTSVTIPESVTLIGESAFERCYVLSNVYYGGSQMQWSAVTIGGKNEQLANATLHIAINCENGHTWDDGAIKVPPTCAQEGVMTYTCTVCGATKTEAIEQADMHSYVDGKCIHCGAEEKENILLGDVNGDSDINTRDAKLIMQYELGLIDETKLDVVAADVNGDGAVNTRDAKLIMQLELGLIPGFSTARRKYSPPRLRIVAFR